MAKFRKIFIGIFTLVLLYFVYTEVDDFHFNIFRNVATINFNLPLNEEVLNNRKGFQVYTPGCQIPKFDPFHPSVRKFYNSPGKLNCKGRPQLVTSNKTHLIINEEIYKKKYKGNARCDFAKIWRKNDGKTDDAYDIGSKVSFSGSVRIKDEFVHVRCNDSSKSMVFEDFFSFIQIKDKVENSSNQVFSTWVEETRGIIRERLNVVLVGIDSLSRLNFLRQMPKTDEYLRNVMNAIDLQGYNKVADNTFVNLVPLLSGLYADECWNETIKHKSHNYLNLIWKDFKKRGYRTLYAEDRPDISTFNYIKEGFHYQPTDYYFRPFTIAIKHLKKLKNSNYCLSNRNELDLYLQWITDYMDTFKDKPHFAILFNSDLSHDDLNRVGYADEIYYKFMKNYYESRYNNNTVLIFFSDHGMRFGDILKTYIGKLEERMPLFFLVFPPWFSDKYPQLWKNLKINEHRLTTPFDIYETLRELLNFTGKERQVNVTQRGISLFSEISPQRTCKDASILPHWCTCRVSTEVDINDVNVERAAKKIIEKINNQLASEIKCRKLELKSIEDARLSEVGERILRFIESKNDVIGREVVFGSRVKGLVDYLITVRVAPGDGLFEGTARYSEATDIFDVSGDISRINLYGSQSHCVSDTVLKKFCFCSDNT